VDYYDYGCPRADDLKIDGGAGTINGMRTTFIDEDVWNSHSMTHAAMSISVGYGDVADALAVADRVMQAYHVTMANQWDYRDTTTTYDNNGVFDPMAPSVRPLIRTMPDRQFGGRCRWR